MAFDITNFAVDAKKETEGVWVDYALDLKLLIGRKNSPAYRKALAAKIKPYRNAIRLTDLSDEAALDLGMRVAAEAILLGWSGMEEDGEPVEYSTELAYQYMKKYPKFYEEIDRLSEDFTLFTIDRKGDARGNS